MSYLNNLYTYFLDTL